MFILFGFTSLKIGNRLFVQSKELLIGAGVIVICQIVLVCILVEAHRSISIDKFFDKINNIRRTGPVQAIKRDGGSPLTIDTLDILYLEKIIKSHS
jgi:hypothetical protein